MQGQNSLTRREVILSFGAVILGDLVLRAQETSLPQNPKFSVDVEVVNVFLSVRDKKGRIVRDLTQEDFVLSEDGRAQVIRYFSRESALPLTVGLIVDTTPSESNMLEEERKASRVFLDRMLRPGTDNAFLIQYGDEIELLQDVTGSREKLEKALNKLERHSLERTGRIQGSPRQRPGSGPRGSAGAYGTVLADAVFLASDEIMQSQVGRKALIILGDGDHVGDQMETAISAALKADTLIYAIRIYDKGFGQSGRRPRFRGGFPPVGGPISRVPGGEPNDRPGEPASGEGPDFSNGKSNLQTLSRRTGGSYYEVSGKDTLEQIYVEIEEELRSQYSLGYTPDKDARNGYRKIQIGVRRKNVTVHGREGYYPK